MKKLSVFLLSFLLIPMLTPAALADAVIAPDYLPTSGSYSTAPWLLIIALVILTLLLLFKFRTKK